MLNEGGAPAGRGLWRPVHEVLHVVSRRYGKWSSDSLTAADQYGGPWSEQPLGGLAAREILAAAEGMSPLQRSVAVRLVEFLGDDALPAWREFDSPVEYWSEEEPEEPEPFGLKEVNRRLAALGNGPALGLDVVL